MKISGHDVLVLLGVSLATSIVVTFVGLGLLKLVQKRSLRDSAMIVALTPVLTVVVASIVATVAMFLSTEQFGVLVATVLFAGCGGVVTSLVLARTIMRGSNALRAAAGALSRGEPYVAPPGTPSAELDALARELEVAHARLHEARMNERNIEESRRELIAWVSHDLRTPLAGIRAMAEALEDGVVSSESDRALYHQRIRVEVDRLARMVDDLFELSRINAGALSLSLERLALPDLVRDAVESAWPVAQAKGVSLRAFANQTTLVDVDRHALRRVVGNLLGNAIRHTPYEGSIAVETGDDGEYAFLAVSDECGGIPPAEIGNVFDVAYRGSAARTPRPDGGAGLGLAIARGIVEAHEGHITAENVGSGCRFTIRIPLSRSGVRSPV